MVVVAAIMKTSNDSTVLTPKTTPSHSLTRIRGQWDQKGERAYSKGAIQGDIQGDVDAADKVDTIAGETITIVATTATAVGMVTTKVATDVAMAATTRYSRPTMMTKTRGTIPQMIKPWSRTMGESQRTSSSVLRKDVEDKPEEALAEVRTDEEAEEAEGENLDNRKEKKRQVLALVQGKPKNGIPETQ